MARAAHALGALGAVPFVGLTPQARDALGLRAVASGETCARAQIAYGATILSFLGGIHWGLAAVKHTVVKHWNPTPAQLAARYAWSVTPSLLAWAALSAPSEGGGVRDAHGRFTRVCGRGHGVRARGRVPAMVTAHALRAHGGGDAEPRGDGVSRRGRRRALEIETSLSAHGRAAFVQFSFCTAYTHTLI